MFWYVITLILAYLIYATVIKPMWYWKERNVAHKTPLPILGNMGPIFFRQKSPMDVVKELYNEFPNKRYNGFFSFTNPQILIRDPELIKQLTIKDFDYFMNRTSQITEEVDPIFSKNLASLVGQQWRDMRTTLSPTFTSSKMRFLFSLISDCAQQFTKYFEKQGSNVISVEMKDVFSRFTNDAIATAAFGVTVDSLNERNNEFFLIGQEVTNFGGLRALKLLGYSIVPSLMKFFKIPIFPKSMSDFFSRIVKETIEVREKNQTVRPDMIHLLLETRHGKLASEEEHGTVSDSGFAVVEESAVPKTENHPKNALTDDDITAQALIFFFAGFETSSTLMSFMSHELAVNVDVQENLREEIDYTLQKCGGKLTYEDLLGMKYLDMVVSESLRKWSPSISLDRCCVKDYIIKPLLPDEEPFTIEKGITLAIPVAGLHHDPMYFPNPEKFDPERFSEENKSNIVPYSYVPFGIGPRSCIASRFALMEIKILFFHLLSKFELVPVEKTQIPLTLSKKSLSLAPDGGFWLGLQQRKKTI